MTTATATATTTTTAAADDDMFTDTPAEAAAGLRRDADTLAASITTHRAEVAELRATITRATRNGRRATTPAAQKRNAEIVTDCGIRLAEVERQLADAEKWAPQYNQWATDAETALTAPAETPAADMPPVLPMGPGCYHHNMGEVTGYVVTVTHYADDRTTFEDIAHVEGATNYAAALEILRPLRRAVLTGKRPGTYALIHHVYNGTHRHA